MKNASITRFKKKHTHTAQQQSVSKRICVFSALFALGRNCILWKHEINPPTIAPHPIHTHPHTSSPIHQLSGAAFRGLSI